MFGLTELKAVIAWKQNVGLCVDFMVSLFIYSLFRASNDGVQRRLCMILTLLTTTLENPELPSCTYSQATF